MSDSTSSGSGSARVVVRTNKGDLIKGFLKGRNNDHKTLPLSDTGVLEVLQENGDVLPVEIESLQSVFFVRSFKGCEEHEEMKFLATAPAPQRIWVRIQYQNGEILEGSVENTRAFLSERGFFLKPADPHTNNIGVYVLKEALSDFHIMGVKPGSSRTKGTGTRNG